VDRDEKRALLSIVLTDTSGTEHEARNLSDGTLRFLALAILAEDPQAQGVICLEEPENGIHPTRIPAMLRILHDLAVDTDYAVDSDNPLRQVVVNTHSPPFVSQIPASELVLVRVESHRHGESNVPAATFRWMAETWRDGLTPDRCIAPGDLLRYLQPVPAEPDSEGEQDVRVFDHPTVRQLKLVFNVADAE
jgi:predicted ATPase